MTSGILEEAIAGRAFIQPWTCEQYHRAIENGFLEEDTAFELLDGFIVRKDRAKAGEDPMTVGDRHRIVVTRIMHLAPQFAPLRCFVQSQQPISLPPINEPEPDIAVVRGNLDDYLNRPPQANELTCVLEVADSSLARDLGSKFRMYAVAGIGQYVVVDLVNNVVLDHHRPQGDAYLDQMPLHAGQDVNLMTPDGGYVAIPVQRLLP